MDEKFTQIKNKLIVDKNISAIDYRVLSYLISHSKKESCFPSYATIANDIDISRTKAYESVNKLVKLNYLQKKERVIGKGRKTSNEYTICDDLLVPKKAKKAMLDELTEEFMNDLKNKPIEKKELFDYDWLNDPN